MVGTECVAYIRKWKKCFPEFYPKGLWTHSEEPCIRGIWWEVARTCLRSLALPVPSAWTASPLTSDRLSPLLPPSLCLSSTCSMRWPWPPDLKLPPHTCAPLTHPHPLDLLSFPGHFSLSNVLHNDFAYCLSSAFPRWNFSSTRAGIFLSTDMSHGSRTVPGTLVNVQ